MTLPEATSQRGVGWPQVVKPPSMIRYFSGPSFWTSLPQNVASGFLRAEQAPVDTLAERDDAVGIEKRSGPRLRVEIHAIGRDAVAARDEQHVAVGDDAAAIVEDLHAFGEELHAVAVHAHRTESRGHVLLDTLSVLHLV